MKILFLLLHMDEENGSSNMYTDLIEEFRDQGHDVSVIAPSNNKKSYMGQERGVRVLRVKSLPIMYVSNMIMKGVGMATLPYFYMLAYNKYLKDEKFDWIFMPTPPITLVDLVKRIKKKSGAKFYMILRDIHPQSSDSLGEIRFKWMVRYLYKRSDLGYRISDVIGCMSPANIDFINKHHDIPESARCEVLYNWMDYTPYEETNKNELRVKYNLHDKFVVLFGGNLGLGQRIENILDLAVHYRENSHIVFVIIAKGIKKKELEESVAKENLKNVLFIDFMPRADYLNFVKSVDLGLISINENNAAPTCPSKILSYMSLKIPTLALINRENDYGQIIENAGAGYWAVGSDKKRVYDLFDKLYADKELREKMGEDAYQFYEANLTTGNAYSDIIKHISK